MFAGENILGGELIEACELIMLDYTEVGKTLVRYVYWFNSRKGAIALGKGSLYNHSPSPNAYFDINQKNKQLLIYALKSIFPGDEITFDYGYDEEFLEKFHLN